MLALNAGEGGAGLGEEEGEGTQFNSRVGDEKGLLVRTDVYRLG